MADFANIAAATAGGYKEVVTDRGAGFSDQTRRFEVMLEKAVDLGPGATSGMLRAYGVGSTQGAAETIALNALNAQRRHMYQGSPGRSDTSATSPTGKPDNHTYSGEGSAIDRGVAQTIDA